LEYNWIYKRPHPLLLKDFESHKISNILAKIISNRGLSYEDYNRIENSFWDMVFNYCDNIVNMNAAAKKILKALADNEYKIFIFSDYDTDGTTSAAIAQKVWTEFQTYLKKGNPIEVYIPNRHNGYGLNMNWCEELVMRKKKDPDHKYMVVTFDNGVTKVKEIKYLRNNNIETIVTDHHEPDKEIPEGIVVDPKKDSEKIGEELCGAGISWLLCVQLYRVFFENKNNDMDFKKALSFPLQYGLGYAAIGTVADMMPMTVFNIALVYHGLKFLNESKNRPRIPIDALKDCFNIQEITGKDIGFSIGAAINACGQIEKIETAYNFLIESDASQMIKRAEAVYEEYNNIKTLTKKVKSLIQKDIDDGYYDNKKFCLILIKENIPHGILGKLANHVTTCTGKPAAAILVQENKNELKGSGRCQNSSINLLELLQPFIKKGLLKTANGHKSACGIVIYADKVEELQRALDAKIEALEECGEVTLKPVNDLVIDSSIDVTDINMSLFNEINKLPYSMNFNAPVLCLNGEVIEVGHSKNNVNNVKYIIKSQFNDKFIEVWTWNYKPDIFNKNIHKKISIAGNLVRDFRNPKNLTLDVIDIKVS